jgi:uncharacterized membrane protein
MNDITLSVWTFGSPGGAASALRVIERLQTRHRLTIEDASIVCWPAGQHRPSSYQAGTVDGTAALSGAFWGLLFGSLFLVPLAGPAGAAVPSAGLAGAGLADDLLDRLRGQVTAGTSALFLLAGGSALATIRDALASDPASPGGPGGGAGPAEPLVTRLDRQHEQVLRSVFGAGDLAES